MAAPLEFRPLVRFRNDGAPAIQRTRVSPLTIPVAAYWLLSAAAIYGMSSGVIPLDQWLTRDVRSKFVERDKAAARPEFETRAPVSLPGPGAATLSMEDPAPLPTPAPAPLPAPGAAPLPTPAPAPLPTRAPAPMAMQLPSPAPTPMPPPKAIPIPSPTPIPMRSLTSIPVPSPELAEESFPAALSPEEAAPRTSVGVSCEAALAAAREERDMNHLDKTPDVSRDAYASVLENGRYLASCRVPDEMTVEICAAVQAGRAVGVTIVTTPPSERVRACVASAVRRLSFPKNPKLDVTHTRFAPAP